MSEAFDGPLPGGVRERHGAVGVLSGNWLGLAATPAFVLMAWLTADPAGRAPAMVCTAGSALSWLGGMTPMYLLMAAFHSGPWMTLIAARRRRARGAGPRAIGVRKRAAKEASHDRADLARADQDR